MSAPSDEIARRVAVRLAPQIGSKLPAYVERVLAGVTDEDSEAQQRTPDVAQILQYATFVVTTIGVVWPIYQAKKSKADALNATELLLIRQQLANSIQEKAQFPVQASTEVRKVIVDTIIDETIAGDR